MSAAKKDALIEVLKEQLAVAADKHPEIATMTTPHGLLKIIELRMYCAVNGYSYSQITQALRAAQEEIRNRVNAPAPKRRIMMDGE